ncbi:serine protease [Dankookia sp. GCM10030260]|uniref:S1 family peptidase n=1 Tax=Dankookia sp. GCM10030260 TaxID=3273390 RepID=UPI0036087248
MSAPQAPADLPLPGEDRILALWHALRAQGLALVPDQLAAAIRVRDHVAATLPDEPLERLRSMLSGVLAKSAGDRAVFERVAGDLLGPIPAGVAAKPSRSGTGGTASRRRRSALPAVAVACVVLLGLLLVVSLYLWRTRPVVEAPRPAAADAPAASVPAPPTSAGAASAENGFRLRVETIERDDPVPVVDVEPLPLMPLVAAGLASLPLLGVGAWLVLGWRRARPGADDPPVSLGERLDRYAVPDGEVGAFDTPDMRGVLRRLRGAPPDLEHALDLDRTVQATAGQAGLFTPVLAPERGRMQTLVLLEEVAVHDHVAHLFLHAARRLRGDGLPIDLFGWSGTPDRLVSEAGEVQRLADLSTRAHRDRIVLVGDADRLISPLGGLRTSLAAELGAWRRKYLLNTRPLSTWGWAEMTVFEAGISLGTATPRGFAALARAAETRLEVPQLLDVQAEIPPRSPRAVVERPSGAQQPAEEEQRESAPSTAGQMAVDGDGLRSNRLVEIFSAGPPYETSGSYGTGYLLGEGLVLTARHVLVPHAWEAMAEPPAVFARAIAEGDAAKLRPATIVWPTDPALLSDPAQPDVAVLRLPDVPPACGAKVPVGWADLEEAPEPTLEVRAAGFTSFMDKGGRRDTTQLTAKVDLLAGLTSGTFVLTNAMPQSRDPGRPLEWTGFSGAPLFAERRLVGVVIAQASNTFYDFHAVRLGPLLLRHDFVEAIAAGVEIDTPATGPSAAPPELDRHI